MIKTGAPRQIVNHSEDTRMPSDTRSLAKAPPGGEDVDRLISDLKPLGRPILTGVPSPAAAPTPTSSPMFQARASTPSGGTARPRGRLRPLLPPMRPWMVRGCVALGALLGAAITQWPYGHACGWGLSFYAYAVGWVVIAGGWGLLLSWKSRLGMSHAIAMLTLIWGLALGAGIVLPRVGYAKSVAGWSCQAPPHAAPAASAAVPQPAPAAAAPLLPIPR